MDRSRPKLFAQREKRVKPARDDKVLAEWNGMMLRAFAYAAGAFHRDDYRQIAEANAEFILREMIVQDGRDGSVGPYRGASKDRPQQGELVTHHVSRFTPARLHRSWAPASLTGGAPQAKLNGYLEDYANVADGLVELYQLTFELRWLQAARDLADVMIEQFWDERHGGFFQTSNDHEALIARPKDFTDNAVPSGNSVATDVLLRLAALTGDDGYAGLAEAILLLLRESMMRFPLGFGHLLSALGRYLARPQEIVVIGDPTDARTEALLSEVRGRFLPNAVLAGAASDAAAAASASVVPLLAGRTQVGGAPTAYVCENFACQLPVTGVELLARQLTNAGHRQ